MLSGVPESKEAVMCLIGQMHVLDKLRSGTGYSAIGCEFIVTESTTFNLNRNTHKIGLYIDY